MKKLRLAVFLGFLLAAASASLYSFESSVEDIKQNVFRLHILANSDSEYDQNLKLMVRDRILELSDELFEDGNFESSVNAAYLSLERIEQEAENVLRENGCCDDVRCEIDKVWFEDRVYDGFTMPAGEYTSLCVYIGEAKGHNWWCVMYPPLCVGPACENIDDYFDENQADILENHEKYEIKFKCVEVFKKVKNSFLQLF